jgi:hypothetical protein
VNQLEDYLMGKEAETSGTHVMPLSAPTDQSTTLNPARTIRKVAEDPGALEKNEGQPGEQIKSLPQAPVLHVDVTDKDAPKSATKQAEHYALPDSRRYPLDNYAQVKQAAAYFNEWGARMAPSIRREYCSNLVKRASALGIEVSEGARNYGASGYGDPARVEAMLDMRRGVIKEAEYLKGLDYLKEKRAETDPEAFAVALGEFDKVAGISELYDRDIHDPYLTTFGEKRAEDEGGAILVGNDYISHEELKRFAKTHSCSLKDTFGDDFCDEFRKDPVGVTNSLPVDQKKIVLRLASSTLTDPTTT